MEKSQDRVHWLTAVKLGGAFAATIIGSGFASGQELVQFFTVYGIAGAVGAVVISLIIYIVFSAELFHFGIDMPKEKHTAFFTVYFGEKVGAILDWFCVLYIYGVFFVMLSGAGATLNQYFGWDNAVGSMLMAVVSGITVLLGLNKLVDIISVIEPLIIFSIIAVGVYALAKNAGNLQIVQEVLPTMDFMKAAPTWLISGILYPCFSFLTLTPVLPSMASMAQNKKTATAATIIGCLAFHVALIVVVLAMFANLHILGGKMVPNLALATLMSPYAGTAFAILIIVEIFSSACPMMWGTAAKLFKDEKSMKYKIGTVALIVGGMVLAYLFPLDVLINFIYALTGYAGAVILIGIFVSKLVRKSKNKHRCSSNN